MFAIAIEVLRRHARQLPRWTARSAIARL